MPGGDRDSNLALGEGRGQILRGDSDGGRLESDDPAERRRARLVWWIGRVADEKPCDQRWGRDCVGTTADVTTRYARSVRNEASCGTYGRSVWHLGCARGHAAGYARALRREAQCVSDPPDAGRVGCLEEVSPKSLPLGLGRRWGVVSVGGDAWDVRRGRWSVTVEAEVVVYCHGRVQADVGRQYATPQAPAVTGGSYLEADIDRRREADTRCLARFEHLIPLRAVLRGAAADGSMGG